MKIVDAHELNFFRSSDAIDEIENEIKLMIDVVGGDDWNETSQGVTVVDLAE